MEGENTRHSFIHTHTFNLLFVFGFLFLIFDSRLYKISEFVFNLKAPRNPIEIEREGKDKSETEKLERERDRERKRVFGRYRVCCGFYGRERERVSEEREKAISCCFDRSCRFICGR